MKAIIVGATSMIGIHLTKLLIDNDIECLLIVREGSNKLNRLPDSSLIKIEKCELSKLAELNITDTYDLFFHLAWDATTGSGRDDVDLQLLNVKYSIDALKLAHRCGCKSFVGAGSQAEYGLQTTKLTPYLECKPITGYGIAKYSSYMFCKLLASQLNIKFNWARILSVYGLFDNPNSLISYAINSFLNGKNIDVTKCEQIWDYTSATDCARALYAIALNGIAGKIYPIGSGKERKLKDYLICIRDIINKDLIINFGAKDYPINQTKYLVADIEELIKDTGYIQGESFEEQIYQVIQMYEERRKKYGN